LLDECADRLGLADAFSCALSPIRAPWPTRSGRLVRDLAAMPADGGDRLADVRAVREQRVLVRAASDATAFRMIDAIASDPNLLGALRVARGGARVVAG
jgi:hypothetical protein